MGLLWLDHMGYDWRIFGRIWENVSLDKSGQHGQIQDADAALPS